MRPAGGAAAAAPQISARETAAEELHGLATRLNRCAPSSSDPERYHVERDAIVREMRALAGRLADVGRGVADTRIWRPAGRVT